MQDYMAFPSLWTVWSIATVWAIYLLPSKYRPATIIVALVSGFAIVVEVIEPAKHGLSPLQYYAAIVGFLLILSAGRQLSDWHKLRKTSHGVSNET